MFGLRNGLPKADKVDEYIDSLCSVDRSPAESRCLESLYRDLTILDGKSASLLQFNSIIIALVSFNISFMSNEAALTRYVLFASFFVMMLSAFILLLVVWVHWSYEEQASDFRLEMRNLVRVRTSRTIRYRLSWQLAFLGMFLLIAFHAMYFVEWDRLSGLL